MVDKETLLDRLSLENGLELSFYDQSRSVAGDRCLAQLLIELPIPIDESFFEGQTVQAGASWRDFQERFGFTVRYQMIKTRHFVPREEVESILKELQHEFFSTGLDYLRHPDFPRRYVLKVYNEWAEKERCRLAHAKALQAVETGR